MNLFLRVEEYVEDIQSEKKEMEFCSKILINTKYIKEISYTGKFYEITFLDDEIRYFVIFDPYYDDHDEEVPIISIDYLNDIINNSIYLDHNRKPK